MLYFTPIHPIGQTNRKGRNNSLKAEPGDPGSPYAIGSAAGRAHAPSIRELGTLEDFRRLVEACQRTAWRWRSISPFSARRIIRG